MSEFFERNGDLFEWTGPRTYRKCDKTMQAKYRTCKELHRVGMEVIKLNGGHDIRFTCSAGPDKNTRFKSWRLNK